MFGLLFTILILDGILLMVVILLQAGKGGGLAAVGGGGAMTDTFIGGRQAATILTKTTWTAGAIFLVLSLVLSVMSSRRAAPESILREEFQQTLPANPQPVLPGLQTEPEAGSGEAPTTPATPPGGTGGGAEEGEGDGTGTP